MILNFHGNFLFEFIEIQLAVFPGIDQYMTLGPFSIGSLELAALSVFMLFAM